MMTDVIDRKAAIDALMPIYKSASLRNRNVFSTARKCMSAIEELPSAQPERLTDDDFETIRIHLNAYKEKLCNQQRWEEADEYQRILDRFMSFASVQPEVIHCGECRYYKDVTSIHGDCECGEMWQSLFGEITEVEAINVHKDHYCGYAERKYESNK